MKWWFKVNRNKLYRKYVFDPHFFILKSFKLDKTFKFLLFARKTAIRIKSKLKKIKIKRCLKLKRRYYFVKRPGEKDYYTKFLKRFSKNLWFFDFWNKIKINYFQKKSKKVKIRPMSRRFYAAKKRRKRTIKKYKKKMKYKFRIRKKKLAMYSASKLKAKRRRRRSFHKRVWLAMRRIKRKRKNWWLLRVALRKAAIYYGFKKLKKFRFVNKFEDSYMSIKAYNNNKLESMLNIFLLKINLFDNIFISNNFIKMSGFVLINNVCIYDPYKYIKKMKIITFKNIAKMQSIFKKRSMFSKSFFVKNLKIKKKRTNRKLILKIINNVPSYIHYDYQIMCFSMYRLPNKKEQYHLFKRLTDNWAVDTKLQYN